jgi:hypothetical protein
MNRHLRAFGLCFLVSLVSATLDAEEQPVRLAVMDFSPPSYWTPALAQYAYPNLGGTISELLTTHLVRAGTCEVVERSRLQQLLNEKTIAAGQAVLDEQARDIGRELSVDAVIVGSFVPGPYAIEVTARTVGVKDGAILAAENISLHWNAGDREPELATLAAKLLRPWNKDRGLVLDVFEDGGRQPLLMLDLGTAQGCDVGRRVEVLTSGDPILHPVTHQVLGTRDVKVGDAVVIRSDKDFSYARVFGRERDGRFERIDKVRLTEDVVDASGFDNDMSVLNAKAAVKVSTDIAGAQVLVDGRPTKLEGGGAQVPLQAGTHLVELALGGSGSSIGRTVTVSKKGAEPAEIVFKATETLGSIAIALPFPITDAYLDGQPQEGDPLKGIDPVFAGLHTLVIPNLAVEGKPERATAQLKIEVKAGEMLTISSLAGVTGKVVAQRAEEPTPVAEAENPGVSVPTNEAFVNQLVGAIDAGKRVRDERAATLFLQGMDVLKRGLRRNDLRDFRLAQPNLLQVTQLDPTFALGHFALGLSYFYAYEFGEAKAAFDESIRLDGSLEPVCPLLWWQDWRNTKEGVFAHRGAPSGFGCYDPGHPYCVRDAVVEFRYRFLDPNFDDGSGVGSGQREREGSPDSVHGDVNAGGNQCLLNIMPENGVAGEYTIASRRPMNVGGGWHVASHVVNGKTHRLFIDGKLMCEGVDEFSSDWRGRCSMGCWGAAPIDIDWVMVRRVTANDLR